MTYLSYQSALLSEVDNSKIISVKRIWSVLYVEYKLISLCGTQSFVSFLRNSKA